MLTFCEESFICNDFLALREKAGSDWWRQSFDLHIHLYANLFNAYRSMV